MTSSGYRMSARFYFGLLTVAPILALVGLLFLVPPDGGERAQWLQFIGRFHPLAVHLPIALLLLVPLIELAGRTRYFPYLLPSADFVLGLATFGAIAASALGWCLARSGGYSGPLVTQHMWGGVAVAGAAWLCWILRGRSAGDRFTPLYALVLLGTVGLVSWTGYRGGQLSQGENHLTEFMPDNLRDLLGISAHDNPPSASPNGGPQTFYGARVQPLFTSHCIACHGRDKHKSNLRLDSYDNLMRGSKHGAVVKPADAKGSELFHRITLPATDEDFMPAENKRPLSDSEVKLIGIWITAGASGVQPADAIKEAPANSAPAAAPAAEVTFAEIDPAAVANQRAGLASAVTELQKRFPDTLDYESRGSADLTVNVSLLGAKFGDNELATLRPIADHIVAADFSNTAITDQSATFIAGMKRLRVLRLMRTKITDTTMQTLDSLDQLESLSVFGTGVTQAALPAVSHMPKLRHLYVGETKITAGTSLPAEIKDKVQF